MVLKKTVGKTIIIIEQIIAIVQKCSWLVAKKKGFRFHISPIEKDNKESKKKDTEKNNERKKRKKGKWKISLIFSLLLAK